LLTLPKICAIYNICALYVPWEIWGDRLSRQCCTYMYILMNHWIATSNTASHCLKNRQTFSILHYLYITCAKCPPPVHTKISDVDKLRRHIKNVWTVWITQFIERAVGDMAPTSTCLLSQIFRSCSVKMM